MSIKAKTRAERTLARLSTGRREAILDERSRRLAERAEAAAAARPQMRMLACAVGANLYGLPLNEIAAIRRFDRHGATPSTAPAVLALVADAGRIRPVLDLPALLGASAGGATGGWLAILAAPHNAALRMDEIPAVVDAEPLTGADEGRARVSSGEQAERTLVILSTADLLAVLPASTQPGARPS